MKTINRNSWIYKVATYGGLRDTDTYDRRVERTNICALFWSFIWGLIRAPFWGLFFGGTGAGLMLIMLVLPLMEIYVWLVYGNVNWDVAPIAGIFYGVILVGGLLQVIIHYNRKSKPIDLGLTDLIKTRYHDWKQKHCTIIAIK